MRYRVDFYADIVHREAGRCDLLPFTYATEGEAENAARAALARIREIYGAKAGFVITDMNHIPIRLGPGLPQTPW